MGLADRDYMRAPRDETRDRRQPTGRLTIMQRLRFVWWRLRRWLSR